MITARHGLSAVSMEGALYTIGGCAKVGGGEAVGTLEVLTPAN